MLEFFSRFDALHVSNSLYVSFSFHFKLAITGQTATDMLLETHIKYIYKQYNTEKINTISPNYKFVWWTIV